LVAETLFDETMLVMTGATNRWAQRRRIELAALTDEPWALSPPGSLPRLLQEEVFHATGLDVPRASVITLSIQLYTIMLETGRWFGLIPASVMRFSAKRLALKILPVKVLAPARPVGIVTVRNRTLSPLAHRFIDYALEIAKPMSRG